MTKDELDKIIDDSCLAIMGETTEQRREWFNQRLLSYDRDKMG